MTILVSAISRRIHVVACSIDFFSFFSTYLDCVDGHQKDSPSGSGSRSAHRLGGNGKIFGRFNIVQEGEYTSIRGCISKSAHGSLDEGRKDSAVESRNTPIAVQMAKGPEEGPTITVLVVHLQVKIFEMKNEERSVSDF